MKAIDLALILFYLCFFGTAVLIVLSLFLPLGDPPGPARINWWVTWALV